MWGVRMKCPICGKEVKSKELYKDDYEQINVAVIGNVIDLQGHKICLQNVNTLVVIPNRLRISQIARG